MRLALCALRAFDFGGIMDSYFVRIYRREEDNPRLLVGVVEEPGGNGKKAFSNLYELWDILNPLKRRGKVHGKVKNGKKKQNNGKITNP